MLVGCEFFFVFYCAVSLLKYLSLKRIFLLLVLFCHNEIFQTIAFILTTDILSVKNLGDHLQ